MMDDNTIDRLLSGDLSKLPNLPKRVVRLFISSTFTDMTLERNTLMERVYPRLKKYCREQHGLDFQVVDMRWGVRDEATDDHQTVNLCSREIENCQRVSLGPNFIALIGDKYGFRPLLNRIKSAEYRLLRRCLIESDISTDFIDTWYKEDLNAAPAEYLLQPISSILKNFTNRNEPELQMVDQRIWQAIQERLHELLLIGSSRLVEQGRMSEREQLFKYSISVTEREVLEGCLDINEPKSQCLVYVRSIVDLRDNLARCLEASRALNSGAATLNANRGTNSEATDSRRDSATRKASLKIGEDTISLTTSNTQTASERKNERNRRLIGRYIDLCSNNNEWHIDENAQKALRDLKEAKLTSRLATNGRNLTYYQVHWNEQDGISLKSDEHKSYLKALTDHFYGNLSRMVRNAVKGERSRTNTTGLLGEVLQHSHYALQVGKSVYARDDELDQIRTYILSGQYHQKRTGLAIDNPILPMFIFGVSGSGKTSILARVASAAFTWIEEARKRRRSSASFQASDMLESSSKFQTKRWDRKPCVIMRFCCTTPASSSMVDMLTSICRQLQYNFYQFGPLNGLMDQNQQQHTSSKLKLAKYDQMPFQQVPQDFIRLVYTFRQLIDNCRHHLHRHRVFVIILDSIERLSSPAESSIEAKYSWLTSMTELPANVRLIVSCSSTGEGDARIDYAHLKRHFLSTHFVALYRVDPRFLHLSSNEVDSNSCSSCDVSGSESLDFSDSSSSSSYLDDSLPEGGRASANDPQPTKYSELLRRVVLPAIRRKQGLESDIGRMQDMNPRQTIKFALNTLSPEISINSSSSRRSSPRFADNITSGSDYQEQNDASRNTRGANYLGLLHVRPLGKDSAATVLQRWLADSGRNLTQQQWAIVARSFAHCSRPIFVKLALGEVLNWKSYSTQGDIKGLTFGSSWLAEMPMERIVGATDDTDLYGTLLGIVQASRASCEDEANKFRWQMLAVEQQWINFLDYRARQEKQAAAIQNQSRGQDENANLEIRIAAGGSVAASALDQSNSFSSLSGSATNGSLTSMSICHLSNTIEDAISQLFARIELQHGYLLTKHSLSYITAARNGICENELEDILSLDDVVLDDVFQYHLPPVRRIPPLLWTRIRNDLPDYLSERDADGIVVTWHHSQFKTVTEKRYLDDSKQVVYIHSLMADYFLGKWADKAKPFTCTKQQIQMAAEQLESAVQQSARDSASGQQGTSLMGTKRGSGRLGSGSVRVGTSFSVRNRLRSSDQHDQRLQWMQAKAHRQVPHQPLHYESDATGDAQNIVARPAEFTSEEKQRISVAGRSEDKSALKNPTSKRYNLRKLTELPYHLLRAGRFNELASCVLFNYKWLHASIEALSLQSLFADFQETLECLRNKLLECTDGEPSETTNNQVQLELLTSECVPSDQIDERAIGSMIEQIELLSNTLRLSSSVIQSEAQMLAPQLIGRLVSVVNKMRQKLNGQAKVIPSAKALQQGISGSVKQPMLLGQLLQQCDRDGCADCALLPIDHCLQSPDGLQLSSLEGHPFAVTSIVLTSDQRHLLAVSSKFIMWNVSTGEVAREIDHKIDGTIMKELKIGSSNQLAIACTSDNHILVLDILTQQIARCDRLLNCAPIRGLKLIDKLGARRFFAWNRSSLFVFYLEDQNDRPNTDTFESSGQDKSKTILIELDYEIDLSKQNSSSHTKDLLDVELAQLADRTELIICTWSDQDDDSMRLSVYITRRQHGSRSIEPWNCDLEAAYVTLSPSGNQIFYSNQNGDIFLRRRRAKSWSRPKLIREASSDDRTTNSSIMREVMVAGTIGATLALEVENPDSDADGAKLALQMSESELDNLQRFERQVDRMLEHDEIESPSIFSKSLREKSGTQCKTQMGVRFIKVHFPNRIDIIHLEKRRMSQNYTRRSLVLPKNVRNVRIERNKCQLISVIMQTCVENHNYFLIVASGKHLLVYSIDNENLLRSIDAHTSRITRLLPIRQPAEISGCSSYRFSIASSSLDKTVKIWNLSNITNESKSIDKISAGQVDEMQICSQRPIVACLSKGQLTIWDWRTMKIVASYESASDFETCEGPKRTKSSPIMKSAFSSNGRYLAVATMDAVYILVVEGAMRQSAGSCSTPALPDTTDRAEFKLLSKFPLPATGLVMGLKFLSQDTFILTTLRCFEGIQQDRKLSDSRHSSQESTESSTASIPGEEFQMDHCVRIFCFVLSDSKLKYQIECHIAQAKESGHIVGQLSRSRDGIGRQDWHRANRSKLVALTCDQHFIVVVACASSSTLSAKRTHLRRGSSVVSRVPLVLNVYSARDGSLVKTIDLCQLQKMDQQGVARPSNGAEHLQSSRDLRNGLQAQSSVPRWQTSRAPSATPRDAQEVVSIHSDQFNRIKSMKNRDRQTLIALLDDERGTNHIIDIATKCLVCCSNEWNGASLSSDGRYGLSRVSRSSGRKNFASRVDRKISTSVGPMEANSRGFRLLEMRRCRTVKIILDAEQMSKLSSSNGLQSRGADQEILCGFTRPNDSYVYYCDSRLKRILLIRLRDSQLIANYRLSTPVAKIKCTNDGFALVLANLDGSLTSLAIVDPQTSDSFTLLSQYPSRRRL